MNMHLREVDELNEIISEMRSEITRLEAVEVKYGKLVVAAETVVANSADGVCYNGRALAELAEALK